MADLSLSVAMIVGHENTPDTLLEAVLTQQLHLAEDVVCVVTVPTDGTWQRLVNGFMGQWRTKLKLVPRPWQHNYALQRNIALAECRGDVVLVTDCDEWWPPELTNDWRAVWQQALAESTDVDGLAFPTRHYARGEDGALGVSPLVDWHTRMFRNIPQVFHDGAIHEQLRNLRRVVRREDILLHHFGWARDEATCQRRLDRRNAEDRRLGQPGDRTLRGDDGPWSNVQPVGDLPLGFDPACLDPVVP